MTQLRFCGGCNRLFEPKPWQLKVGHGHARFCPDCAVTDPRWSAEYRRARARRHRIARGRCESCGTKSTLQCHHVEGDRTDHRVEMLRMLCVECHRAQTAALSSGQVRPAVSTGAGERPSGIAAPVAAKAMRLT